MDGTTTKTNLIAGRETDSVKRRQLSLKGNAILYHKVCLHLAYDDIEGNAEPMRISSCFSAFAANGKKPKRQGVERGSRSLRQNMRSVNRRILFGI
jgi:hypothetical protein